MLLTVPGSVPSNLPRDHLFRLHSQRPLTYKPDRTYRIRRDVRKFHRRPQQGVPSQRDGPIARHPGRTRSDEIARGQSGQQVEPSAGPNARRGPQNGICGILLWCP